MARSQRIRQPAVAGRFYPGDAEELRRNVEGLLKGDGDRHAVGIVVPHAGYVFSGAVAGQVFGAVRVPDSVIVLCPNHTGRGARISVAPCGFQIPGAEVPLDDELVEAILAGVTGAERDAEAHLLEHAIEVELPFLLARNPAVTIAPVVVGPLSTGEATRLGEELQRVAAGLGREVLVVASSDMSHYLPDGECRRVDQQALRPLLAFDPEALHRTVRQGGISMCGVVPVTAMLSFARAAGSASPELIAYATSGDASGDRDRVVGYAGVVVPARPG